MTRYILIDNYSGFIWGDTEASTPIEAAKKIDNDIGGEDREYTEKGPHARVSGSAYHVYEAPADFPQVEDGQSQATIDAVDERLQKVALVEFRSLE